MPKDPDDETPKKRNPEMDVEDEDFDELIEKNNPHEDDEGSESEHTPKDITEKFKARKEESDSDFDDQELKAATTPVFADTGEEDDTQETPKPTFKYNVAPPPPPSDEPTILTDKTSQHTLDDISEDDLNSSDPTMPKRPFQVDRGIPPEEETAFSHEPPFPRPRPVQPAAEEDAFGAYPQHDNLDIPSIRKSPEGPYPPHQSAERMGSRFGDDDQDQYSEQLYQRPQVNAPTPRPQFNPYAPTDGNSRFGGGYSQRQNRGGGTGATKWHIIVLLLIGGGVIAATVYLLQNQFGFPGKPAEVSPSPVATIVETTPEPTPTPIPVTRSEVKVRVLNGTTESGIAKSVMDKLKGLGYQSDRTGNAAKQDYTATMIRVKEGDASISAQLTQDLAPEYAVASVSADLKSTETIDAEIILGEK